jgi:hypothetical protein
MRSYRAFWAKTAITGALLSASAEVRVVHAQANAPAPTNPAPVTPTPPSAEPAPAPAPSASPAAAMGELNVRTSDEQGTLFIDGREVGQGSFRGAIPPGRHQLRVTRPGYETFEAWLDIEPGQVRAETVSLRQSVQEVVPAASPPDPGTKDGLYGGLQLFGAFQPSGAGTTFEDACDTTGATSCSPGGPLGAGLSGYLGWLFDPLGLELGLFGSAHVEESSASFDGVNGSEINPIVASPAREEKFTIGRFGGGASVRGRLWYSTPRVRFTVAAGPGLLFRSMAFERETEAVNGFTGRIAESGIDYLSPMLSLEAGAELRVSRTLALSLGVLSWFETASDNGKSAQRTDTVLLPEDDTPPVPHATPAYDLANGTQWFIGPYLGLAFGP